MAIKEVWLGTTGPFEYDNSDTDVYPDGKAVRGVRADQLYVDSAPTDPNEVARLSDLPVVSGYTGTLSLITNTKIDVDAPLENAILIKTRLLTFTDGLLSTVGTESDWTATPL